MKRRADAISDAVINQRRQITVTGHLVGDYSQAGGRVLLVHVAHDAEVEVHPKSKESRA